jgi:hypothetical protein
MKTNMSKRVFLPVFVAALVFAIGGCSKETLRENEPQFSERLEKDGTQFVRDLSAMNNASADRRGMAAQNKLLAEIRRATAKYQDFSVAVADGYVLAPQCNEHHELGGMGFHAFNPGLFSLDFDPLKPQVLIYEPMEDGELNLVAVEFVVAAHAPLVGVIPPPFSFFISEFWDDHYDGPPTIGIQPFDDHRDFENMGGPPFPHYQLHIWLWKGNPNGVYTPYNPNVSCEFAYLFAHLFAP